MTNVTKTTASWKPAESVTLLGETYTIEVLPYDADPAFKKCNIDGYCENETHRIVIGDLHTWPGWGDESENFIVGTMKHTLRHEIVHLGMHESGLQDSSHVYNGAFAKDEELIDWIAIQGPKIYKAWEQSGAL